MVALFKENGVTIERDDVIVENNNDTF